MSAADPLSLNKKHIRFLLLEGLHPRAARVLAERGYDNVESLDHALQGDDLAEALQGVHFLGIRSRTQVTEEILAAADRLVALGCFCIGTNQVDLDAAEKAGVPVFNAPFSNTRSVAELALAEIIMLMRGIPEKSAAAHEGRWLKSAAGSHEIRGKTLGIIGYGHIGSQLGVLAEALGMQVRYHDIENKLPLGNAQPDSSLNALLDNADVISLHVPETPQTCAMIDTEMISRMRKGSHLVNASRGSVVDVDAVADALKTGHLAGAALDVFPEEPRHADERFTSPLQGIPNVILTPHIGGSTLEAQENIALEVASKMVRYSDNGSTLSAVNFPEVALPDHAGVVRMLHIHRNEPGVLQRINQVFSGSGVNIAAQYLQTSNAIGYVVMDVEAEETESLLGNLAAIDGTIRVRRLL